MLKHKAQDHVFTFVNNPGAFFWVCACDKSYVRKEHGPTEFQVMVLYCAMRRQS